MGEILSRTEIENIVTKWRQSGKKIVFTNGCFDLLHVGHIHLLKKARELGEFLLVGINSDKSIRKIKGGNRPIIPQEQREEMLMALECVNSVFVFDEPTPYDLIRWVQPTIIVKGEDWAGRTVVGSDLVSRVEIIPFVHDVSTTSIIRFTISSHAF